MLHSILAFVVAGYVYTETAGDVMKDFQHPATRDIAYVHNVIEYQDEQDNDNPNQIHVGYDYETGWFCYDNEGKVNDFISFIVETNRHSES